MIPQSHSWASTSMLNSFSLTVCDPVDCSPPGSSVHGILQAKIVEWVAISFSRGSSLPRNQTNISYVSCIGEQVLYHQHHLENLSWAYIHRKASSKKMHATQCSLQHYLKQPKYGSKCSSTEEQIKKSVCIYNGILLSHKKE